MAIPIQTAALHDIVDRYRTADGHHRDIRGRCGFVHPSLHASVHHIVNVIIIIITNIFIIIIP